MRRFFIAFGALLFAGCASGSGSSPFEQGTSYGSTRGARPLVVQRGDGAAQGATFALPPSSYSPRAGIVRGDDGNMWFGTTEQFASVSERGTIDLFAQPRPMSELSGGVARGPVGDHHLWYTISEPNGAAAVARVSTPSGEATIVAMPPHIDILFGIAAGPGAALYAASYGSTAIVKIPTSGRDIAAYPLTGPAPGRPANIVLGPDGAMWFTMPGAGSIGRFDIASHAFSYVPIPTPDAGPIASFAGAIYFAAGYDRENEYVGKVSPGGGITQIVLPAWNAKVRIESLCAGPDERLWAGGFGALWSIGKSGDVFGPALLPGIVRGPSYLGVGADGNMWSVNDEPASISVYLLHALTASSTSFDLTLGQSAPLAVSERAPGGELTARSADARVATVVAEGSGRFTIDATGVGATHVRVSDRLHNFVDISVSVTP